MHSDLSAIGLDDIVLERANNGNNEVFLTQRKFLSEIPSVAFLLIASFVFFLVRYVVKYHLWKPLALSHGITKDNQVERFTESAWYSCYYTAFLIFGCVTLFLEDWTLFPTTNLWAGWPLHSFNSLFKLYYLLEMTFYFHCMVALTFEQRRKDFNQVIIHHLATFSLVGMSYWVRYHRVGLLILIVHNISDVFLYSGKCVHYLSKVNGKYQTATNIIFVIFALSFLLSRLVVLPFVLVRSTMFESMQTLGNGLPLYWETNISLVVLIMLHSYWFYLIVRMTIRVMSAPQGPLEDLRSDSEDEGQEGKKPKGKRKGNTKKSDVDADTPSQKAAVRRRRA